MMDKDGRYWLLDFGLAFVSTDMMPYTTGPSIIGTWFYYSPGLFELNELLIRGRSGHGRNVSKLIVEGNLYSLQAVILDKLSRTGGVSKQCARLMQSMWAVNNQINEIYDTRRYDRFMRMEEHLQKIWSTRKLVASEYLRLNPKAKAQMFALLIGTTEDDVESEERRYTELDTLIMQEDACGEQRCDCCIVA